MQLNKNIKFFINYFLGPVLFIWLAFSIYRQIVHQPKLEDSWLRIKTSFRSTNIFYLILAVVLIPVNWGIEAWKWQLSVRHIHPISFSQAFKAVLSGLSISVTLPNRVGEYVGRMMFMPEGSRLRTISVTLVGSMAQFLVTLVMGTAALMAMKDVWLQNFPEVRIWFRFLVYALFGGTLLLFLIYFNVSGVTGLFRRWLKAEKQVYLVEALQFFNMGLLLRILFLSVLRYSVFLFQYLLIFYLFDVDVSAGVIVAVTSVVFLAMAVIPSIALVEVGLRGEISMRLMGLFSTNLLGISFASITVWFLNLVVPAIIGSILILNIRVFRKRRGTTGTT